VKWRFDRTASKQLEPAALESIQMPTLVISARDDRYGTFASAQYTANQIAGAKFIGFETGGHTWVGHDDEVRAAIVALILPILGPDAADACITRSRPHLQANCG